MMVHRLLTRYLAGGRTVQEAKYEELCDHSSEMEQIAANAERASVKYKQVEFMGERGHGVRWSHFRSYRMGTLCGTERKQVRRYDSHA